MHLKTYINQPLRILIFVNRDRKFVTEKQLKISDSPLIYYYWIADENSKQLIDKRFIPEEIFAIYNQFT